MPERRGLSAPMDDEEFFRWYGAVGPARPAGRRGADGRLRPAVVDRRRLGDRGVHRRARASTRTSTCRSSPATSPPSGPTSATRGRLWSIDGGTLRPLSDRFPEVLDVESQIWIRRSAHGPVGGRPADHAGPRRAVDQQARPRPRRPRRGGDLGGRRRDPLPAPRDRAALQGRAAPAQGRRATSPPPGPCSTTAAGRGCATALARLYPGHAWMDAALPGRDSPGGRCVAWHAVRWGMR